ncbi:transcription factor SPEECHLESS-like [Typha latifolia]|uniref:transcription factor SPEECHLESS-like n=1 Tax=Typha latifolia TaxID=4733 RepID=UPI003C2C1637
MGDNLQDLFEDPDFGTQEDLFRILETLDDATFNPLEATVFSPRCGGDTAKRLTSQGSVSPSVRMREIDETDEEDARPRKKFKYSAPAVASEEAASQDGPQKMSHIAVERNRRKQMNEHLSVLRSLMPCFYVKRGDQASIIGGVVDYIKELQQVLQSLEAKKQRKVYSEVLSPRPASSPRPLPLSPRPPPKSPRICLPISPRTPQPGSPYKPRMQHSYMPSTMAASHESTPSLESSSTELAANSKTSVADVEVKFSGPNVLLKTVSHRIPGQATKIIAALESLSLEILHVSMSTIDDTMMNSFTIKIGIECELSAEELVQEIQQTFS